MSATSRSDDHSLEGFFQNPELLPDSDAVAAYVQDRTVLVTGAGGSIGAEICRQIATYEPAQLVLLGRGENSIYEIDLELRENCRLKKQATVVADIRDRQKLDQVFSQFRPEVVFHSLAIMSSVKS